MEVALPEVLGRGIAADPQVADPARDGAVLLRGHELPSAVSRMQTCIAGVIVPGPGQNWIGTSSLRKKFLRRTWSATPPVLHIPVGAGRPRAT